MGPRLRPLFLLVLALTACGADDGDYGGDRTLALSAVPGGDPARGEQAMQVYGCDAGHTIPGVRGAYANVGPPLTNFARRQYIAGQLANTPENLISWIMTPEAIEPGTAMPNVGVTEPDARAIAAYLATLR